MTYITDLYTFSIWLGGSIPQSEIKVISHELFIAGTSQSTKFLFFLNHLIHYNLGVSSPPFKALPSALSNKGNGLNKTLDYKILNYISVCTLWSIYSFVRLFCFQSPFLKVLTCHKSIISWCTTFKQINGIPIMGSRYNGFEIDLI